MYRYACSQLGVYRADGRPRPAGSSYQPTEIRYDFVSSCLTMEGLMGASDE